MSGTKAGGKAAAATNKSRHGADFYARIGSKGGSVKSKKKGFGIDDRTLLQKLLRKPKRAQIAGKKGGTISRRTTALTNER